MVPAGSTPRRRSEDEDWWSNAQRLMQRYAILWIPLMWLLTALGFGYVTPTQRADDIKEEVAQRNAAVAAKVDTTRAALQAQIDAMRTEQEDLQRTHMSLENGITVLIRLRCIDPSLTEREKRIAGLLTSDGRCIRDPIH